MTSVPRTSGKHYTAESSSSSVITYNQSIQNFSFNTNVTSAIANDIRQVQTDLHEINEHEKNELIELNERLRIFIDRVHVLESRNSKYAIQLADFRMQSFDMANTDTQWNDSYLYSQSNLTSITDEKLDSEFSYELFQLQIGIYQKLLSIQQQWTDERRLKLEEEVQQLANILVGLRASYVELEHEIKSLHIAREDTFKQYLILTQDWCGMKKQQKKLILSIDTLKNQLVWYKSVHSYSLQHFESLSVQSIDAKQFWSLELDKCISKIRHDFELLYATIYRKITSYYETKIVEIQTDVEQAVQYYQSQTGGFAMIEKTIQVEYEELQKNLSYEKETQMKLEATYEKLELELQAIESENEKQFEAQSIELQNAQKSIVTMVHNVGEIRQSTLSLEMEIIVYRHLLQSYEIEEQVVITPDIRPISNEITEKVIVVNESKRKGAIGIKECAASGKYISLVNHSTNKDIDMSKWTLKRRIDSDTEVLYTIPEGVRLNCGKELTIYSKLGANGIQSSLTHQDLISDDLVSWGMGSTVETILIDRNGEEKASHTQSLGFGRNNIRDQ